MPRPAWPCALCVAVLMVWGTPRALGQSAPPSSPTTEQSQTQQIAEPSYTDVVRTADLVVLSVTLAGSGLMYAITGAIALATVAVPDQHSATTGMFYASTAVLVTGLAAHLFVAPAIHTANGRGDRGAASFGLRLALLTPGVVLTAVGAHKAATTNDSQMALLVTGPILIVAALPTAMALDWLLFADPPRTTDTPSHPTVAVSPLPGGALFSLAGRF